MDSLKRRRLLQQILWDYSISVEEIEAVLNGEKEFAGHFSIDMIFRKLLESYSWFTIVQFFSPTEVKVLLTTDTIKQLRSPALRKKYAFIQQRLQTVIPATG